VCPAPSRLVAALLLLLLVPAHVKAKGSPPPPEAGVDQAASSSTTELALAVRAAQQTARTLRGRFTVITEPPFVVAGDSGAADVRRHAEGLIRWSVAELKKHYFAKDPPKPITIWLFRDRASYEVNAKRLTGEDPDTPFGFFSPSLRALIMNIRTGGGTLVHEIVHPFMEANVPGCPAWLNEGMGSLYEGVGRYNHQIWGYVNWRLPGLQRVLRARKLPRGSLAELLSLDDNGFYLRQPGLHYAEARYLLYYLQDKGLLQSFFASYLKNRQRDRTGAATLKQVLGITDLDAFQRRWERYLLGLVYRNPPTR
jgi:hypothetical protein